jgi:hypothetical protein
MIKKIRFFSGLLALCSFAASVALMGQERPNIILILADDMGFNDIGAYQAPALSRQNFLLRTAVVESAASFSAFIDALDANFEETQVSNSAAPSSGLATISKHFYIGDVHNNAIGGGVGAADFEILEVLVYDRVLTPSERALVQEYLRDKYTRSLIPPQGAQVDFVRIGELSFLSLDYHRPVGGTPGADASYRAAGRSFSVEQSDDLAGPWATNRVEEHARTPTADPTLEKATVRSTVATDESPRQFLRLRIEE